MLVVRCTSAPALPVRLSSNASTATAAITASFALAGLALGQAAPSHPALIPPRKRESSPTFASRICVPDGGCPVQADGDAGALNNSLEEKKA